MRDTASLPAASRRPAVLRRIHTFARQPLMRQMLTAEAAVALLLARLDVWRRGQFGALVAHGQLGQAAATASRPIDDYPVARDIAWAVGAVGPFMRQRTPCLIDALAAAKMLSRRSIPWVLTVGVDRDDHGSGFIAHAWLLAGSRVVTGRRGSARVTPLATYSSRLTP